MIMTPLCPECGQEPNVVVADGHQAFCQTEGCIIFIWDQHLTAEENRNSPTVVIDLDHPDHRAR